MNSTDQAAGSTPAGTEDPRVTAGRVLAMVADHFTATDPSDVLEPHSLLVCVGAEAYKLADRSTSGGADKLARAALDLAPELTGEITRGEYALRLFKVARVDSEPVIPRFPEPRTEAPASAPKDPENAVDR
ncbi:hypothetical protein ACFYSJ_05050 [Streptomyces sp. NPDC005248]|uniref:hypothetical protein n=1 Tax=Streptomyces sp. NPDC005248 TaxID=3364709 RepID=UPI0036B731B7